MIGSDSHESKYSALEYPKIGKKAMKRFTLTLKYFYL